ncbi:GNAT family N-acetyltransferase [Subtercola sp. YIM 133946]|uniref:GNAT family N-acetyltransferase n=1 Tax=Subtercola sp. YIM 133946 TaxID=3118909 RepID=UPI002F92450F
MIRQARVADIDTMIEIEDAANEMFRSIGMADVSDDPFPTVEYVAASVAAGAAWVHADDGRVTAYLLAERLDRRAHIEQVTVHPDCARRGIGAALIRHAAEWAVIEGLDGLSLTTFAHVPWNAPYYRRLGFVELREPQWTKGLRHRVELEARRGLTDRVVMVI